MSKNLPVAVWSEKPELESDAIEEKVCNVISKPIVWVDGVIENFLWGSFLEEPIRLVWWVSISPFLLMVLVPRLIRTGTWKHPDFEKGD